MRRHIDLTTLGHALAEAKEYHHRARQAVKYQEELLMQATEYTERAYKPSPIDLVENFTYTLMVLLHPQLHNGDAEITVRGPASGLAGMHVSALPHVIRQCWRDGNFDNECEKVIHDMILGWGVMEVRQENSRVDNSQDKVIPVARHVHPDDLYVVPDARSWEDCSCFFRRRVVSRKWLLKQAESDGSWDRQKIEELRAPDEWLEGRHEHDDDVYFYEGWARPSTLEGSGLEEVPQEMRDEVDGVRFWINEDGESIRPMAHHMGLEGTPYVLFGAMRSTSQIYPMGVAVASGPNADGVEGMIAHIEAQVRKMQKLIFARVDSKDLDNAIENAIDGIIPVGMQVSKEDVWDMDIFGPRKETYEFLGLRQDARDRVSGLNDLMRGESAGSRTSATEASIMRESSNVRLDGILTRQYRAMNRVVKMQAFYATVDSDVVLYLAGDASEELGYERPRWRGGLPKGFTFESLGLDFHVSNGHRLNPMIQSKRILDGLQVAALSGNIKKEFPDANIDQILRRVMENMQVPELRGLILGEPAQEPQAPQQLEQAPGGMQQAPMLGQGAALNLIQ